MKTTFLTLTTLLLLSNSYASDNKRTIELTAYATYEPKTILGYLPITNLGSMAIAKQKAKKSLKKLCREEYDGKIKGRITAEVTRFDAGDMMVHTKATGNCRF